MALACIATTKLAVDSALDTATQRVNNTGCLNFGFQATLDGVGTAVEERCLEVFQAAFHTTPEEVGAWLDKKHEGYSWEIQALITVGKSPLCAAWTILTSLYSVVKNVLWGLVHPLQAGIALAKFLVNALYSLKNPDTLSSIGAALIGAALGSAAIGNPFSMGMLVAGLFIVSGGMFFASFTQSDEQIDKHLSKLPKAFVMGFLAGLTFGAMAKHAAHQRPHVR